MPMETMMIPGLVDMVLKIIAASENVPIQRDKCRFLSLHIRRLGPLLQQFECCPAPLSPQAQDAFKALWHALNKAHRVVQKMQKMTKLRLMFENAKLSDELCTATNEIQICLGSLPLLQLKVSTAVHDEVKELRASLEELGEKLKDSSSFVKDRQDLAAEVLAVLRNRNMSGNEESAMQRLLSWLADRFDYDVNTVRLEWQEMKMKEIEYSIDNKKMVEEELLQQIIICLDDLQQKACAVCKQRLDADTGNSSRPWLFSSTKGPEELCCAICINILDDPVILESGHSYCRACIVKWFDEGQITCPVTRAVVQREILFENIAIRGIITRWKEDSKLVGESSKEIGNSKLVPIDVSDSKGSSAMTLKEEALHSHDRQVKERQSRKLGGPSKTLNDSVFSAVSQLKSDKNILILKGLKSLANLASSPSIIVEMFEAGALPLLSKLLQSSVPRLVEKSLYLLKIITDNQSLLDLETTEKICSAITEQLLDLLIFTMRTGTVQARLLAGQAVVNLMDDEEVRYLALSEDKVVSAFFDLTNMPHGTIFSDEAKETGIKGLKLLAGSISSAKSSGTDDGCLVLALTTLAAMGETKVREDSIVALESLVRYSKEAVCNAIQAKAVDLVLYESLETLPEGPGREATVKILESLILYNGIAQRIVDRGLIEFLLQMIPQSSTRTINFLNTLVHLIFGCMTKANIEFELLKKVSASLFDLLQSETISLTLELDILTLLHTACQVNEALATIIQDSERFEILIEIAKSGSATCRAKVTQVIASLVKSGSGFRKPESLENFLNVFCNMANEDDNLECRGLAAIVLERLATIDGAHAAITDRLALKSVVELLHSNCTTDYQESAAGILCLLIPSADINVFCACDGVEKLVGLLQKGGTDACKRKAATALVIFAEAGMEAQMSIIEAEGLAALVAFANEGEREFKDKLLDTLASFSQGPEHYRIAVVEAGCLPLLLEALEKGRLKEKASFALAKIAQVKSVCQSLVAAGFLNCAVKCMHSISSSQCCADLASAVAALLDEQQTLIFARELDVIPSLIHILVNCSVLEGRRNAALALAKIANQDQKCSIIIGKDGVIKALLDLSSLEMPEGLRTLDAIAEEPFNKLAIHQEQGIPILIATLSSEDTLVQELASSIIWKLTRDDDLQQVTLDQRRINIVKEGILTPILKILSQKPDLPQETIKNAIKIVRNLSLSGSDTQAALLAEEGELIKVLLEVIQVNLSSGLTNIVRCSVIALERFMHESRGRKDLVSMAGITVLVQVLKQNKGNLDEAKCFVIKILVQIVDDSVLCKPVCTFILAKDPMVGLKYVLEHGQTSECKRQALMLLKTLILSGHSKQVCKSVREAGCIQSVLSLRSVEGCYHEAVKALHELQSHDKKCKALIAEDPLYSHQSEQRISGEERRAGFLSAKLKLAFT